ncbi:hypothetical protein, partial [Pseudomonas sp.]|uniref:hypothetical protein n=1 Tax=Pseudomonas sp. TaxID=306 RepID=UPI00286D619B
GGKWAESPLLSKSTWFFLVQKGVTVARRHPSNHQSGSFERINLGKRKGINEPNASVREQLAKVAVTYPCIGIRLIDRCPAQCWAISI